MLLTPTLLVALSLTAQTMMLGESPVPELKAAEPLCFMIGPPAGTCACGSDCPCQAQVLGKAQAPPRANELPLLPEGYLFGSQCADGNCQVSYRAKGTVSACSEVSGPARVTYVETASYSEKSKPAKVGFFKRLFGGGRRGGSCGAGGCN